MRKKELSILILNYKSWKDTLKEAQMVHDLFDIDWEQIIIVDNASPNESSEMLSQKKIGNYTFIKSPKNGGYAAGNNIGLKWSYQHGFKYCWILNNDIIIQDSMLLSSLMEIFEKAGNIACVNPDIYSPDGHMFNRDSVRMTFYDLTVGFLAYRKKGRNVKDRGGYAYIYRPQGCCMIVDLEKMNSVGYMDEHTFLYSEEIILAERLLVNKWVCACAIGKKVIHNHSKTVKSTFNNLKVISMQNNSFNYYLKEYRNYPLIKRIICLAFNTLKCYFTN